MRTKKNHSGPNWSRGTLIAVVCVSVLLVSSAAAFYVVLVKVPTDLASQTVDGISRLFNFTPQVRINETVVIEQNSPILEVATVSRSLQVENLWADRWLGSTKTVEVRATFEAKAGFDLSEPFTIEIQRYPLKVKAALPDPKLLSLEMKDYQILKDENGWWNRVADTDREEALRRLQASAREKAENSGILTDARTTAEERIREIIERNGASVEF